MRMIMGLDRPTAGTVTVNGRPYAQHRSPLTEVGALLDAKAVHTGRSAYNHLRAMAATHAIPTKRVDEVIEMTGLQPVAKKRVGGFSLGMGQRLGIASALLGDPKTLILDEPVNGLDPEGVLWVRNLARYLASEGRTVFLSSHLMSEVALTADHIIVIGKGRIIADAPVSDIVNGSQQRTVRVRTRTRRSSPSSSRATARPSRATSRACSSSRARTPRDRRARRGQGVRAARAHARHVPEDAYMASPPTRSSTRPSPRSTTSGTAPRAHRPPPTPSKERSDERHDPRHRRRPDGVPHLPYRLSFGHVLRSEWIKFRTLRSTWWTLGITVVVMVGFSLMFAAVMSSMDSAGVSAEEAGMGSTAGIGVTVITVGYTFAQLAVAVLGALTVTGEYSTGMIRSTLSAVPSRLPRSRRR